MNQKHPREEAVFEGALQLPAGQREAYLQAACQGDTALLERITALLSAHEKTDAPLKDSVVAQERKTISLILPPSEQPGEKIGNYKILQLIGEGGCGSVYMAEQEEPVRRRVALKVIKLGMDTKNVVARFEAERQALAMMDHPNIARVFDAGATATGRPYFVMELVRGIKITEYCDQHNLPTLDRLKLFTQVCRAIQHAHQKGIIHRDIKPSNILVTLHDGVPVPKVIDFGIAKATDQKLTDKTLFTQFEQFIGTPAYMSPEQAEMSGMDIDTRSDIYSLGVLLYELLTSQTPFDPKELLAAGLDAMRLAIREKEPPRPSTKLSTMVDTELTTVARRRHLAAPRLIHLVKGDLDWIVMKSLEKDRTRRYDTASNFAADVEHFLNNEPVIARAPSASYRFGKFARRNKVMFTASAAVAVAILAGLVVSTVMYFRERQAREQAALEARRSEQVVSFLQEMLSGVGPAVALGRDTSVLREILDKSADRVARDLKDQPEVQAEIWNTIGEVYRSLGQSRKAEEMHRNARSLLNKVSGVKRKDVTSILADLALALRDEGHFAEAEMLQREVLHIMATTGGAGSPDYAIALNNLGLTLRSEAKLQEAEKTHLAALELQKNLFGGDHLAIAVSLNNLALVRRDQGRYAEAADLFRESLAMEKKLVGEVHPGVAITLDNLAFVLRDAGDLAAAEQLERQSLAMQKRLFGSEHPSVATSMNNLGMILGSAGKFEEGEALMREAFAMRCKLLGPDHLETAMSEDDLALVLRKDKKLPEAESLENHALAQRRRILGSDNLAVATSMNNLGLVLHDESKLAESESSFEDSLIIQRRILGTNHVSIATTMNNLALVLKDERRLKDAEVLTRQSIAIKKEWLADDHPSVVASLHDLSDILALENAASR